MKRFESPPRIVYVERNRLWSVLILTVALLCVGGLVAEERWGDRDGSCFFGALALVSGVVSWHLLFRANAFIIDPDEGHLEIRRQTLWRKSVRRVPLDSVRAVRIDWRQVEHSIPRTGRTWTSRVGHLVIVFKSETDVFFGHFQGPNVEAVRARLAQDLGVDE